MKRFTKCIALIISVVMVWSFMLFTACKSNENEEIATVLSSIAVTTQPTKTVYDEGETFDPSGMVVTASYSNGTTSDVTRNAQYSPTGKLAASDTTINITYREGSVTQSTSLSITVNALPVPTSISITTQPILSYVEGDYFNPTGMVVTATYDNGSTGVLSSDEYTYDMIYDLTLEDSGKSVTVSYINPISQLATNVTASTDSLTVESNANIKTNLTLDADTSTTYRSEYTIEAEDCTLKVHSNCEFDDEGHETKCYYVTDDSWANKGTETSGYAIYKLNHSKNVIWCKINSAVAVENISISLYMATVDFSDFDSNVLTRWNGEKLTTGFNVKTGGYSNWTEFKLSGLSLKAGMNTLTLSVQTYCANIDKMVLTLNPDAELDPASVKATSLTFTTSNEWTGNFTERTQLTKEALINAGLTISANYSDGTSADVTNDNNVTVFVNNSGYFLLQDENVSVSYSYNGSTVTQELPVTVVADSELAVKDGWIITSENETVKIEAEDTYFGGKKGKNDTASGGYKVGEQTKTKLPLYIKLKSNITTEGPVKISLKICMSATTSGTFEGKFAMFFEGERIITGLSLKNTGWNDYTSIYEFEIGEYELQADEIYTFVFSNLEGNIINIDYFEFSISNQAIDGEVTE